MVPIKRIKKSEIKLNGEWTRITLHLLKGEVVLCEKCRKKIIYDHCAILYTSRYNEVKVSLCESCDDTLREDMAT